MPRLEDAMVMDFETYSEAKLGKDPEATNAWCYAEHPSTEILNMAFKFHGERAKLWIPGFPFPPRVLQHVAEGKLVYVWNLDFEFPVTAITLRRQIGDVFVVPDDQWRDIQAGAAFYGMPLGLDDFCKAAPLDVVKDMEGHKVMKQVSKPKRATKKHPYTRYTRANAPDKFEILDRYARQDGETEWAALEFCWGAPCLQF